MDLIKTPEFQIILQLLSPDYMWSAARQCGDGDAIIGAPKAYKQTRTMIRGLINQARDREKKEKGLDRLPKDLEFALMMRALGWPLFGQLPPLLPLRDRGWYRVAQAFWPQGEIIPGGFWIDVPKATCFNDMYKATIMGVSYMLDNFAYTNKAVLDGRVWQRSGAEVMIFHETRSDLKPQVINPAGRDKVWLERKIFKGMKTAVKSSKSEMNDYTTQLLVEWARAGFIGSPAGAMVSGCNGADQGWAALAPANGIPLAVCVNAIHGTIHDKCYLGVTLDHRAFNGKIASLIYSHLDQYITEKLHAMPKEGDINV
jgi:hypothetical protein